MCARAMGQTWSATKSGTGGTVSKFPLTDFICSMLKADPAAIRRADPIKLAAKYDISPDHAAGYLAHHCGSPMSPVTNEGAGR